MTGMYATVGMLAALTHRDRTGEGQYIDMALLDVQVAMLANMNTNFLASGKPLVRWGNAHPNIVPYQTFQTSDGWIIVAVGNDGQFRKSSKRVGGPISPMIRGLRPIHRECGTGMCSCRFSRIWFGRGASTMARGTRGRGRPLWVDQ